MGDEKPITEDSTMQFSTE